MRREFSSIRCFNLHHKNGPAFLAVPQVTVNKRLAAWPIVCHDKGMNSLEAHPVPGQPAVSFSKLRPWPGGRENAHSGPRGEVRPVAGPHSVFCQGPHISLPLSYTLKVIEPVSCRVISTTRMAGPEEAYAALKLLGPTRLQPVLISKSAAQFLPRLS